jgi:hypothetical protein
MTREQSRPEGQHMKLREPPLLSLARSGGVTLPAAAGHDVTLLDLCFRDGEKVAPADDVRDARPQAIGALFARLRSHRLEGDLRRLGWRRVGTALAPTRQ